VSTSKKKLLEADNINLHGDVPHELDKSFEDSGRTSNYLDLLSSTDKK
jgi:hypothetical protein